MEHSYISSIVNPTTVTSIFVVTFLYYLLRKPKVSHKSPPEASGAWPIIGHLPLLKGPQPLHTILGQMADKYGPIFTIRIGVSKTIIVSSWEIAKECFTTNDIVFANRSKAMAAELMGYNYAMFGFSSYGPYWRQVRKLATLELLSSHRLQMLSHVREAEVKFAIKDIYELWVKNNKKEVKMEMNKWFGDISLNTVLKVVVGKRFVEGEGSKENSGDDDQSNGDRCRKEIKNFFELIGSLVMSDAIPYLRWFDIGGYAKAMKKTAKDFDQMVQEWLEEHKQKRSLDHDGEVNKVDHQRDFMGVMLSILDGAGAEEFSSYDADTIIKATCVVRSILCTILFN